MFRKSPHPTPPAAPRAPAPDRVEILTLWLPGESCPAAAAEALIDWIETRGRPR